MPVKPLREVAHVTFDELTCGRSQLLKQNALTFTASLCGKYILVAESGVIYAYELLGSSIKAITSVVCPRKVLAMSMDVSPRRLAIAALMEGRMGIMCSIRINRSTDGPLPSTASEKSTRGHSLEYFEVRVAARRLPELQLALLNTVQPERAETGIGRLNLESGRNTGSFEVRSNDDVGSFVDDFTEAGRARFNINQAWHSHLPRFGDGRRITYYHQICSDEDPPRSVAMCPKRSCVAYGCSRGIELHWIDALTGQDLSRWFPLTGPSDHLYFLPPRDGLDSPRRLRLISSAAHPTQRHDIAMKFMAKVIQVDPNLTNSFWGTIGFEASLPTIAGIVSDHDHYRAVPMSDGIHIMFADPDTGLLTLGSDTPAGDARRLTRKIIFLPPTEGAIPLVYASTLDSTGSPKIVCGFGDEIVLYSVPSDVLEMSRKAQKPCCLSEADLKQAREWMRFWPKNDIPANHPGATDPTYIDNPQPRAVFPLSLRGVPVGLLRGLQELSINTKTKRVTIWAFAANGDASVWQLDDGTPGSALTQRSVGRDGRVLASFTVDPDGDVLMQDPTPAVQGSPRAESPSDLHASTHSLEQDLWESNWDDDEASAQHDHDDDIFMMDEV